MDYKVLITTSGIGSRLGELTDYTNKALIRIGDKPAISHIIEMYPNDTEFVITLGHFGDYVKQFLQIAYPNTSFTYINVDPYVGPGSSLGYSILQAKQSLQGPFIFNACDTILKSSKQLHPFLETVQNFCVGDLRDDTSQYSTLLVDNNKVRKIKERGELNYDYAYIGLCGIKDYDSFWTQLEEAYRSNSGDFHLFEGDIINKMIENLIEFNLCETDQWLDIGNVGELEKTRQFFKTSAEVLEKKEESIYFYDNSVIKFFADDAVNNNRVIRASHLGTLVPPIISSSNNFYKYKKINGKLLSKSVTRKKFHELLQWANTNLWLPKESESFNDLCKKFYVDKTESRIRKYISKNGDSQRVINHEEVPPIKELFEQVDVNWLCDGKPVQFHGDFILDNILETEEGFCLLDWRQDFAGNLKVGDIYYDLAKLNHNLTVNHEIVNQKMFDSSHDNCYILCNSTLNDCRSILQKFVINNGYDWKKVQVLTAIIWINMAPLHDYPFNKFLFNFGKLNLKRSLNEEY
jgi:NDP-sugar pyrophosphorylase family protein